MKTLVRLLAGHGVGVDGVISTGKTTLCRELAALCRRHGVAVHEEPERVHEALLASYIAAPRHYGFAFQCVMANDAVNRQRVVATMRATTGALGLVDRPVRGNRVFARLNKERGNISEADYAHFYERMLPLNEEDGLSCILFLHVDLDVALYRMGVRDCVEERDYDESYIAALNDAYFVSLLEGSCARRPLIAVPWNTDGIQLEALLRYVTSLVAHGIKTPRVRWLQGVSGRDTSIITGPLIAEEALLYCWGTEERAKDTLHGIGSVLTVPWSLYADGDRKARTRIQRLVVNALCALVDVDVVGEGVPFAL